MRFFSGLKHGNCLLLSTHRKYSFRSGILFSGKYLSSVRDRDYKPIFSQVRSPHDIS